MYQINCPDLAFLQRVQDIAKELGLEATIMHEPKHPDVHDGLRVVRLHGLEDRLEMFTTVLPVEMSRYGSWIIKKQNWLGRLWASSPDFTPSP